MMTLCRVFDLLSQPLSGVMADVRPRNADGSLKHHPDEDRPFLAPLKKVYMKKEDGDEWLTLSWDTANMKQSCGFSGRRIVKQDGSLDFVKDWFLLVDFPDQQNGGQQC